MPNTKKNDRPAWEQWRDVDTDKLTGKAKTAWENLGKAHETVKTARNVLFAMCQPACDEDIASDPAVPETHDVAFLSNKYGKLTYIAAESGKRTVSRGKTSGLVIKG